MAKCSIVARPDFIFFSTVKDPALIEWNCLRQEGISQAAGSRAELGPPAADDTATHLDTELSVI